MKSQLCELWRQPLSSVEYNKRKQSLNSLTEYSRIHGRISTGAIPLLNEGDKVFLKAHDCFEIRLQDSLNIIRKIGKV